MLHGPLDGNYWASYCCWRPNDNNSSLGWIWPQEWPLGKSGYTRRLFQQRWGHTRHPGDESGAKGEGKEGKMFSNFLVAGSREALCLAFMSYKYTYNVLDGRNAPLPELEKWHIFRLRPWVFRLVPEHVDKCWRVAQSSY